MSAIGVCCVKGCEASSTTGGVSFYSLPSDKKLRLQWLEVIGRTDICYNDRLANQYVVCSRHFNEGAIRDLKRPHHNTISTRNISSITKGQTNISFNTAPQTHFPIDDDDLVSDGDKVVIYKRITANRKLFTCCEIDCDDIQISADDVNEGPSFSLEYSEYLPTDRIDLGNRKIFTFCEDENAATSVNYNVNISVNLSSSRCLGDNKEENIMPIRTDGISLQKAIIIFKKFFEWRQRTTDRRKGGKYERAFEIFALNLHTLNTRAYRLLMVSWQLPKENELKNIQLNIGPKFDEQVEMLLAQKLQSLSKKEKFCTLGLYTMALKPHFYYDPANDDIIGVQNVNGDKKGSAAIYALIAMVRGIIVPWHQPVAYSFFTTMTDVDNMDIFVESCIQKLKRMGLKILGVVMGVDQYFFNYVRSKHFISTKKLFIRHGTDKLFVVFDVPHVLNMFKEEFLDNEFVFENKNISGKYIKQVYDIDKEKGSRLLPNLTDKHIKVGSKETNPEHILQVFSKVVCGAIYFYKDHGLMDEESTQTGLFINKVSEVFDVLMNINKDRNNESVFKMVTAQNKAIDNACSLFKKLMKNEDNSSNTDAHSLNYFLLTFKSLWNISFALKNAQHTGIAHTRFCNLEPMLDFIELVKKDAKTKKPSPIKFTQSFSKLFLKNLIELTPAPSSIGNMDNFLKMADSVKDCYVIYSGNRIFLKDHDYRLTLPEHYAIIYVSSFFLYKCSEVHACKIFVDFMEGLIDLNKTKMYVNFENYNKEAAFYYKLKLPPIEFPSYVERLDEYFFTCFNDFFHKNPAETIYQALQSVTRWKPPCRCFPNDYMLKLFVRTRLYETILYNTKRLKNVSDTTPYTLEVKKL